MRKYKRLSLVLKSINCILINSFSKKIYYFLLRKEIEFSGPISFPSKRKLLNLLRSPHKDKDSRDQFELKTFKKVFFLKIDLAKFINLLKSILVPSGIELFIKLF